MGSYNGGTLEKEHMAKLGPLICPQNTITYYTMDRYDLHFDFISISGDASDIYLQNSQR